MNRLRRPILKWLLFAASVAIFAVILFYSNRLIKKIAQEERQRIEIWAGAITYKTEIINETELRPIINVEPNYESVYKEVEQLVLHPERIPELKRQSIEYVRKHHDYLKVANQYLSYWELNRL